MASLAMCGRCSTLTGLVCLKIEGPTEPTVVAVDPAQWAPKGDRSADEVMYKSFKGSNKGY